MFRIYLKIKTDDNKTKNFISRISSHALVGIISAFIKNSLLTNYSVESLEKKVVRSK
jgi:hypothetical protein